MANYKDKANYVSHNLNNSTITIDGDHVVTGVNSISFERTEEEINFDVAGDGTALPWMDPSRVGTITLSLQMSSTTNTKLWELYEAKTAFAMSHLDSARPDYDAHGNYCYIQKVPMQSTEKEPVAIEWNIICGYLSIKGGSFTLQTA